MADIKDINILIVEDEKAFADMMAKRLERDGYKTQIAYNGVEGIQALEKFSPQLVILDLNMPGMGGIEFYRTICEKTGRPSHPVLIVTARGDMKKIFMDFDVAGFLTKPFPPTQLTKEVELITSKSKRKRIDEATGKEITGRVFIIDENPEEAKKIAAVIKGAGYIVDYASDVLPAVQKIINELPHVVLINLNIKELPGDLIVLRLEHMSRTAHIKFILYVNRNFELNRGVTQQLGGKTGVAVFTQYVQPEELVPFVDEAFNTQEEDFE